MIWTSSTRSSSASALSIWFVPLSLVLVCLLCHAQSFVLWQVAGFLPLSQRLLQLLVLEKEKARRLCWLVLVSVGSAERWVMRACEQKTKEGMKMMGLRGSVFSLGWHITYSVMTLIPCILIAGTARSLNPGLDA